MLQADNIARNLADHQEKLLPALEEALRHDREEM
jgi:hypothetical protein